MLCIKNDKAPLRQDSTVICDPVSPSILVYARPARTGIVQVSATGISSALAFADVGAFNSLDV
jgi:hypothetical protein